MKVGVLTGGGDCPGLNPAIRGIIRRAHQWGDEVVGLRDGWKGIMEGTIQELSLSSVDDLLVKGGTVLGTSRTNPYKEEGGEAKVKKSINRLGLDALIAIGGEDTLGVAHKLTVAGLPLVGLPKTIDNDLEVTDFTLGFPTAVEIATEAMDRLRTTAESHNRVMIVEIMGRHAGWLTAYSGLAGGADAVLLPEFKVSVNEVCEILTRLTKRGKNYAIIAIAEGASVIDENGKDIKSHSKEAVDSFGHVALGGIGDRLKELLKQKTGRDIRATVLGHTQRGGAPTAFDRILSTAFGVKAMELAHNRIFGKMPALVGGRIEAVPLSDAVAKLKTVGPELNELLRVFFG